ncbi:MAG TPA: hypothetical protein VMJ92_04800, partial [Candidatus Limnocylindrales bacterium]|nr:hypothetical protein [Candidatus Limnocylindrales bacterium]
EPDAPSEAELHEGSPADVAYRVAAGLALEADERQRLLEASTARERIEEELRLLARESSLLKELLVRLRARGEGGTLN